MIAPRQETALELAQRIASSERFASRPPPRKIPAREFPVRACLGQILPAIFDRHCPDCRGAYLTFGRMPPAYYHAICVNLRGRIYTAFWWTMILLRLRTDFTDGGSISGGRWVWKR